MEREELVERLSETPLADGLSRDELGRLAAAGEVRQVPAGEVLLREGEPGAALLVVLEGGVEVLKADDEGVEQCLVHLAEQTVLGEVGIVLGEAASATVRTELATTLFVLDGGRFRSMIESGQPTAAPLALSLGRILARRLRRMNEEAASLCRRYEEALAEAGETRGSERVEELAAFKRRLLQEWNF